MRTNWRVQIECVYFVDDDLVQFILSNHLLLNGDLDSEFKDHLDSDDLDSEYDNSGDEEELAYAVPVSNYYSIFNVNDSKKRKVTQENKSAPPAKKTKKSHYFSQWEKTYEWSPSKDELLLNSVKEQRIQQLADASVSNPAYCNVKSLILDMKEGDKVPTTAEIRYRLQKMKEYKNKDYAKWKDEILTIIKERQSKGIIIPPFENHYMDEKTYKATL